MSDGGWYGYPSQEPDPYSQPQDDGYLSTPEYGNAPQASGYDQYGQSVQGSNQQQYRNPQNPQYYPQQPGQGQGRRGQQPGQAGQSGPGQSGQFGQPGHGQPGQQGLGQSGQFGQSGQGQSGQQGLGQSGSQGQPGMQGQGRPRPQQGPGQPRPGQQQGGGQGQGNPGMGGAPGQSGQYRQPQQPRPRQRPTPQSSQQSQNPYFQQQQQDFGYDTGTGGQYSTGQQPTTGYDTGYEGYGQQPTTGYDTGGYPRQDYERSGYDTSTGYSDQGYDSAAGYDAASYGSGSYDTDSHSGGYNSTSQGGRTNRSATSGSYAAERDPYSDLTEVGTEEVDEFPGRGGRRRAPATGEQTRVSEESRFGLLDDRDGESATESPSGPSVDEDDDEDNSRRRGGGRSGGKQKGKKARRSCMVIFLFFAILAGGLGYGGYQGYKWYQGHYGAPADYSSTTGIAATAIVTVPDGAGGTKIASILYSAGVVESERAFIVACDANSNCANIQANTYQLHKQMSAAAAVTAMLNTGNIYNKAQLLVRPGERASAVFADLEQKTSWTQSQILAAINSGNVDLPSFASAKTGAKYPFANFEGLLFTGTYQLPSYSSPTALIKAMVDKQLAMFNAVGLTQKASALGMSPYQVLIVASMARAEAGSDSADLGKISGVIYTRLKDTAEFAHLGFDTTTLYGMGNTTTVPDNLDSSNPYNTSIHGIKGLPPGPIDSVDQASVAAALAPSDNSDLYFCAVNGTVLYATTATAWHQLGQAHPGLCGD